MPSLAALNFINDCLGHGSHLVRAVANYGIQYGLHNSFLGRNASFSARRYNCRYHDISSGNVNAQHMINNYVDNLSIDRHVLSMKWFRLEKKYLYNRSKPT